MKRTLRVALWRAAILPAILLAHPPASPAATPRVLGVEKGADVTLSVEGGAFAHQFLIVPEGDGAVEGLEVAVSTLRTPAGDRADPGLTLDGKEPSVLDLAAGDAVVGEVTADLPEVGEYRGFLTLRSQGGSAHHPLVVTRAAGDPPVEVRGLEIAGDPAGGEPEVWFQVVGKRGARIERPQLVELHRRLADEARRQARFERARWKIEGKPAAGEDGAWPLAAGQAQRFVLALEGLSDPGSYHGKLRVPVVGGAAAEADVALLVKRGWLAAAFWIFLGVLTSFLLTWWARTLRPRLATARRIHLLLRDLEHVASEQPDLEPGEKRVRDLLLRRLKHLLDEVDVGAAGALEGELELYDLKLSLFPEWVNGRRRVAAVEPPDLRDELGEPVTEAGAALESEAADKARIEKAREGLRGLEKAIAAAVAKRFVEDLETFEKEVEGLDDEEILGPLGKAKELAENGELAEARRKFAEARLAHARRLTKQLEGRLEKKPVGFKDNKVWREVVETLRRDLEPVWTEGDPEVALDAYRDAYRAYFEAVLDALDSQVQDDRSVIKDIFPDPENAKRKTALGQLDEVEKHLETARSLTRTDRLAEAEREYAEAVALLRTVRAEGDLGLSPMGSEADSRAPLFGGAAAKSPADAREVPEGPTREPHGAAARRLGRQIERGDLLVSVAALLVAVLLGWKLLWASNPVWGSFDDVAAAVLWGLGLHSVSNVAFEGVQGLRDRLTGTAAPAGGGG